MPKERGVLVVFYSAYISNANASSAKKSVDAEFIRFVETQNFASQGQQLVIINDGTVS